MPSTDTKKTFTVVVNNTAYETAEHKLTGAEIKTLAGVPSDYELFEVRGAETIPVPVDETVHLKKHNEFRAIPAGTFGRSEYDAAPAR